MNFIPLRPDIYQGWAEPDYLRGYIGGGGDLAAPSTGHNGQVTNHGSEKSEIGYNNANLIMT